MCYHSLTIFDNLEKVASHTHLNCKFLYLVFYITSYQFCVYIRYYILLIFNMVLFDA